MLVLTTTVMPSYNQVMIWDEEATTFPLWEDEAPVSALADVVAVATRSDLLGGVVLEVHEGDPEPPGEVLWDGTIDLGRAGVYVGNVTSAQERWVPLSRGGPRRLRILVDAAGDATRVVVAFP